MPHSRPRAPQPRTTSGQGPPFFTIAGIQESVATQKNRPLMNQRFADARGSPCRESQMSGASAKRTSATSHMGGKAA